MFPRRSLLPLAALAATAVTLPAAAQAKGRSQATYNVTIKATIKEAWDYHYLSSTNCIDAMCTKETVGSGSATTQLRTKGPQPVWVMRGMNGRKPLLSAGTDDMQVTGNSLRTGSMVTTYSGEAKWTAANPTITAKQDDCGNKTIDGSTGIAWADKGYALRLSLPGEPTRDDCPDGPPMALDWSPASPSSYDVPAAIGKNKLLGTKQFTIRGSRTFVGTIPSKNTSGPGGALLQETGKQTVTIQWEATFRMKKGR